MHYHKTFFTNSVPKFLGRRLLTKCYSQNRSLHNSSLCPNVSPQNCSLQFPTRKTVPYRTVPHKKEFLTKRFLTKRFLTKRFLTKLFLIRRFLTKLFLTKRFLTKRFLTKRFLTKRFLTKRFLTQKVPHKMVPYITEHFVTPPPPIPTENRVRNNVYSVYNRITIKNIIYFLLINIVRFNNLIISIIILLYSPI